MKRKLLGFTKSIVALRSFATMLLFISAFTVGWGTNYIHWGVSGTSSGWEDAQLSGSPETATISLEAGKTYQFLLTNSTDNNGTWWKFNGSSPVEVSSGTEYQLSTDNTEDGKITVTTSGTYTFKVVWTDGNPTLTVTFPSSGGGSESNFKLMKKDNTTPSEAGTSVATFTGSTYPYTATYDITTAGTYYFYVNDGTKDYLNSGKLTFSNGTECTLYKYGDTGTQYDHAITLNAQTTGTYTFTFSKSGDNYSLKCDYPSTSSTTYYLVGDENYFGGWNTTSGKAFTNGEVSVDVSSTNSAAQFKILKSDGKTWYGSNSSVSTSQTSINLSTSVTDNAHINLERTGTYTFKMTDNGDGTIKLDVTYPTVTATVPTNLKFQSDAEDGWASKGMTSSNENKTWTYTLDMAGMNKEVVWFRFIDETNTNACVLANSNGVEVPADGSPHEVAYLKSSSTENNFKFYTKGATKYTIVATQVSETNWSVTITPGNVVKTEYVLNCGNASYSPSQSGDVYTFTLPKSAYTSNLSFNIAKTSGTTTTYLGASSNTLTGHNNEAFTIISEDNAVATNFTYTASSVTDVPSGDITVTYDANGKTLKLYYVSQEELLNKSYYVVFPDANVGNTARADKTVTNIPENHTAFRLIPSRNRNATTLDDDLLSINLKIDGGKGLQLRYDTEGKIKFYITDGKGKYLTGSGVSGNEDNLSLTSANANNGVDGYVTRNGSLSAGEPKYYYTISETNAIDAKSLTFMFAKDNTRNKEYLLDDKTTKEYHTNPNSVDGFKEGEIKTGNLIVGFLTSRGYGSDYYTQHISKGVYLVGQMNGVKYTHDKSYEMNRILYPSDATEATADSIVYSCTVKKGSANWDDFFLSFSTGDKVEDGNKLWNLLLRPSVQNQMDGQALEGGVTFFKNNDGTDNAQQALNPLLSAAQKERYVSYTIYFNATYSTYRIEFHDGFYIAGAAVDESGSYAPENRIAMSSAELNGKQHYIYTGKFVQGEKFAFFLNEDSYTFNYCEDNNAVSPTSATDAWYVQAPANGADYAFYNRVLYNTTGDNTNHTLGDGKSGMTWGLPTGTYTIRFYNHAEKENNNQLYTVDKEVLMANVTSTFKESVEAISEKVHNYGGWRTLSDDCALLLPNGVKAYYAAKVGNGKVYLKELTYGYIPAHCPVILSNPNLLAGNKSIAFPVRPDDYTVTLAEGEQNYLKDCYDKAGTVDPEVTENDTKKYNYFFSYKFKFVGSKVMSDVPLGFWKPFAGTATKKNYSYLSIDTQLNPSRYDEDTYTFNYSDTELVFSSKAYCFVMAFDEDELGDNTTTGIDQVKENAEVDMTNAVWHNMQGVRITKPSAPGMYICNGKKVVVR